MTISRSIARPVARPLSSPIAGGGGEPVVPDPVITVQPTDQTVALGETAVFSVTAEGTEPITYQWYEWKDVLHGFVSRWDTRNLSTGSSASNEIRIPTFNTGSYSCVVDWGDESSSTITTWDDAEWIHSYMTEGEYTIRITGTFAGFRFNNIKDKLKLLSILNWSDTPNLLTNHSMFRGCANLTEIANGLDTTGMTTLSVWFRDCTKFSSGVGEIDTSLVTDFSQMFRNASKFNEPLNWDTSAATTMAYMFSGATSFNQDIGGWNISKVTDFSMFMNTKNPSTFSVQNLDAIYNGWSSRPVKPGISISFGSAKYSGASSAGRAILTSAPNNWVITDGGMI